METTRPTLKELEAATRAAVDAVNDDAEGRFRMRQAFYAKWGFGEGAGFGTSELAFLRWELQRGVLEPLDRAPVGSAWWRAVNSDFLYLSELAGAVHDAGLGREVTQHEVLLWLDYLRAPTSASWYRAHNGSIVRGYVDHIADARAEGVNEQLFMNEVLYRLLYAEALVVGVAMGAIGEAIANPRLPAVDALVQIDALYPRHYPLDPTEVIDVHHMGSSLGEALADVLDEALVLPHLAELYALTADLLGERDLDRLIKDGKPIYPDVPGLVPAPPKPVRRKKIAILGGGMSALTAAHELTRHEGWQELYEVTVYQMGWRVRRAIHGARGPRV